MNKLLKDLYDCFYIPPEFPAQKQETEECHQTLIEALDRPERRLVTSSHFSYSSRDVLPFYHWVQ